MAAIDSCFGLIMTSSAWHSPRAEIGLEALCSLLFAAEAGTEHPFKRQLQSIHVGAIGWEPFGSSNATCAKNVDQARADHCVNKFIVKRHTKKVKHSNSKPQSRQYLADMHRFYHPASGSHGHLFSCYYGLISMA